MDKREFRIADWLPEFSKFWKQMIISFWTYITFPFSKEEDGRIYEMFYKNYYVQRDTYFFDGSDYKYYEQLSIDRLKQITENKSIIDLGSGIGSFYRFLSENNIAIKQYIGIDFAVKEQKLDKNAFIKNIEIDEWVKTIKNNTISNSKVFVMSNSLCYLKNEAVDDVFNFVNESDYVLIYEPQPHIFWDAHFYRIKPHYRDYEKVIAKLEEKHIQVLDVIISYVPYKKYLFFGNISYCIVAKK